MTALNNDEKNISDALVVKHKELISEVKIKLKEKAPQTLLALLTSMERRNDGKTPDKERLERDITVLHALKQMINNPYELGYMIDFIDAGDKLIEDSSILTHNRQTNFLLFSIALVLITAAICCLALGNPVGAVLFGAFALCPLGLWWIAPPIAPETLRKDVHNFAAAFDPHLYKKSEKTIFRFFYSEKTRCTISNIACNIGIKNYGIE